MIKVGSGYAIGSGTRLELWGRDSLFAGVNKLFVELFDSVSGARLTNAHIHFGPEMDMMGGMSHSCPLVNPSEATVNNLFQGYVFFIMPTSSMGSWKLDIEVHNHSNNKEGSLSLDIDVANPTPSKMTSFTSSSGKKIFVGYSFEETMKVGINDVRVMIYEKNANMEFVPSTDYTIAFVPEMPSMGHSSPNNVDPEYSASDTFYHGKVNYTMSGDWRLNFTLTRPGDADKSVSFDLTVK
jgi:hypothetical protein